MYTQRELANGMQLPPFFEGGYANFMDYEESSIYCPVNQQPYGTQKRSLGQDMYRGLDEMDQSALLAIDSESLHDLDAKADELASQSASISVNSKKLPRPTDRFPEGLSVKSSIVSRLSKITNPLKFKFHMN